MNFKNTLMTALMATGTMAMAETENTNVNVQVTDGEGQVIHFLGNANQA